jgi:hypothetical protein
MFTPVLGLSILCVKAGYVGYRDKYGENNVEKVAQEIKL